MSSFSIDKAPLFKELITRAGVASIDHLLRQTQRRKDYVKKIAKLIKDLTMFKIRNDHCYRTLVHVKDKLTGKWYAVYKCRGPGSSFTPLLDVEFEREIVEYIRRNSDEFYRRLSYMWPITVADPDKALECISDGGRIEASISVLSYKDMRYDIKDYIVVRIGKTKGEWDDCCRGRRSKPITIYAGNYHPVVLWRPSSRRPVVAYWLISSRAEAVPFYGKCTSTGDRVLLASDTKNLGVVYSYGFDTSTYNIVEALVYASLYMPSSEEADKLLAQHFLSKFDEVLREVLEEWEAKGPR